MADHMLPRASAAVGVVLSEPRITLIAQTGCDVLPPCLGIRCEKPLISRWYGERKGVRPPR